MGWEVSDGGVLSNKLKQLQNEFRKCVEREQASAKTNCDTVSLSADT